MKSSRSLFRLALIAGLLAQAGLVTTISADLSGGDVGQYVFATSGIALILTAIFAPDGLTGLAHRAVERVVGPPAATVERSDA